jgi:hypothetical protein
LEIRKDTNLKESKNNNYDGESVRSSIADIKMSKKYEMQSELMKKKFITAKMSKGLEQ